MVKLSKTTSKLFKLPHHYLRLAGLLIVIFGVVDVIVFLWSSYALQPIDYDCPVGYPVSGPCINLPPVPEISYVVDYNNQASATSTTYLNYANEHSISKIDESNTRTEWERVAFPGLQKLYGGCFLASSSVSLNSADFVDIVDRVNEAPVLTFNYAMCPQSSPRFYTYGITGSSNTVTANWFSESNPSGLESELIMRYWNLDKPEDARAVMNQIIKSLPSVIERNHCVVTGGDTIKTLYGMHARYFVKPDDFYKKYLADQGFEWSGACYPYSTFNGQYFEVIDKTLLFVMTSYNDFYDRDSLNVIR